MNLPTVIVLLVIAALMVQVRMFLRQMRGLRAVFLLLQGRGRGPPSGRESA